jgi:hypothetical protein
MTKQLLVCGDSFLKTTHKHVEPVPEWCWLKQFCDRLGYTPLNLAMIGASNFNIWHQLDYGIKHYEFDAVLVFATSTGRLARMVKQLSTNSDLVLAYNNIKYHNVDRNSASLGDYVALDQYRPLIETLPPAYYLTKNEISMDTIETWFHPVLETSKDFIIIQSMCYALSQLTVPKMVVSNIFPAHCVTGADSSLIPQLSDQFAFFTDLRLKHIVAPEAAMSSTMSDYIKSHAPDDLTWGHLTKDQNNAIVDVLVSRFTEVNQLV